MIFAAIFNIIFSILTSVYFVGFLGVIAGLLGIVYVYLTRNFGKWEKKYGFKGLKPVPFFGTEKDFLLGTKCVNHHVVEQYKEFEGHKFGIVYQGARPTIFVRDLELLKNICIKDFDHFANLFGDNLDHIVDSNMFFTNGEKWRHAKSALSQVYRHKNIKDILPTMDFCIKKSMKELDTYARTGEEFRIDEKVIEPCLLDCVGHAVFGVQIDAAKDSSSEFARMVFLFQSSIWRFLLLNVVPEFMAFFGINVFYPKAANYLNNLLRQLLEEHKKTRKFDDMMGVHLKVREESEKKKGEMIAAGEEYIQLTDEMITSSVMQFFIDGVATIGSMLETAIFYMAQNPELQEKAFEEIERVLGDRKFSPEEEITYNDIMEMKYIAQIFTEASRIAAFPFIWRICTKDYPMPETNFVVPMGTPVYIPILGFHMDPKYFKDPEKFDPERFSADNKDNLTSGSYMTFGQGPRMCLGKNFIKIEGRCYLANLIRSFKIFPSEKTLKKLDWDVEVQGRIKGGLWVRMERREM